MANESKRLSPAGYAALRLSEGVEMHYYNDPGGNNCTWGIVTLEHLGPCSKEELDRTVLPETANAVLEARVHEAERQVKAIVANHELTQEQFDAALSFAYNSRTANIRQALNPANIGDMESVARHFMHNMFVTPRDKNGHATVPAKMSHGLMMRRTRQAAPFQQRKP